MSQENVEIVRAVLEKLNRGEWDAVVEDNGPDFQFDFSRAIGPQRGVFGPDGVPEFFRELAEHWESIRFEADEFLIAGDCVVTPFTNRFRGRDGIEVQARAALVWTLSDRKVASVTFYQERREALEAAGLEE